MSVRFLLFRGKWENEGIFNALETEKSIIIFSTGQDYHSNDSVTQQVGKDYLKERKHKIAGIIVSNTSFHNISLLENLCLELGSDINIYSSLQSKIIINSIFPRLRNKVWVVDTEAEKSLGEFQINFLPCNSYIVGNLAVSCHYANYSFYFLQDFYLSSLIENRLFNQLDFFSRLGKFISLKREITYLITSCQNIYWSNNNSLLLAKNSLPSSSKEVPFFILYNFDWLHIIELLELSVEKKKRLVILNNDNALLIKKMLGNDGLRKTIHSLNIEQQDKDENVIYLLLNNPQLSNTEEINYYLEKVVEKRKGKIDDLHFVLGLPPVIGGEEKLARIVDFLYTKTDRITNLSKSKNKYFRLGISFAELQVLGKWIKPHGTILLNNSYKNKDITSFLPGKLISPENNHFWEASNRTTAPFSNKKTLISLEEILIEQRSQLKQAGLLMIFLTATREKTRVELKDIIIEKIAISFIPDDTSKLEFKIRKWWESKLTSDIEEGDSLKTIKMLVEKRLVGLIKTFVNYEYGKDIEDVFTMLFVNGKNLDKENYVSAEI